MLCGLLAVRMLMALPAVAGEFNGMAPKARRMLIVEAAVAAILLAVGGFVIWKLAQLCQKVLPNPPTPPPETNSTPSCETSPFTLTPLNAGAAKAGQRTVQTIQIPVSALPANISCITNNNADFLDPSGVNYYTHLLTLKISSTADYEHWNDEGTVTMWFNENYLLLAQTDSKGNIVTQNIYSQGWNNIGATIKIPYTEPLTNQLFFKIE